MFNLIRRISYGVIPRPDRPWEEDATSNAPAVRRKRRLSSTERDVRDDSEELARGKKARGGSLSPEAEAEGDDTPLPQPEAETIEVKEVTQGVKDVVLDAESAPTAEEKPEVAPKPNVEEEASPIEAAVVAPESIPLPEDRNAEVDDLQDAPTSSVDAEDADAVGEVEESEQTKEAETLPPKTQAADLAPEPVAGVEAAVVEKTEENVEQEETKLPDNTKSQETDSTSASSTKE